MLLRTWAAQEDEKVQQSHLGHEGELTGGHLVDHCTTAHDGQIEAIVIESDELRNHNNMPDFVLSSVVSNDLIAYILSLKQK